MTATVAEVRTRMVAILHEYVTTLNSPLGLTATVFRYLPRQLNAAELPAFIVLPSDAAHTQPSPDEEGTSRAYLVRLFYAASSVGTEGEIEEMAETLLDDVRQFLNGRRLLQHQRSPLAGVISAWVESDSGFREAPYPDTEGAPWYLMSEFRWRVISRRNRR